MINELKNNAELICIIPAAGKSSRYEKSNKIFESLEDGEENGLDVLNASILNINTLGVVKKIYIGYDDSSKEFAEFKEIINNGVTDDELNRIKMGVISGDVYQKDSVFNIGMFIGQLETMGYSHTLMDQYTENVKKVTSAQIQEAAKKYLVDDKLTIVTIDPQPINSAQ